MPDPRLYARYLEEFLKATEAVANGRQYVGAPEALAWGNADTATDRIFNLLSVFYSRKVGA